MKNVKSYNDFCNEEINWKKAAAGAALGASLAISNPVISQEFEVKDKIENTRQSILDVKETDTTYDIIKSMSRENGFDLIINSDTLSKAKSAKLSYSIAYLQGFGKDKYSPPGYGLKIPAGALFGLHIDNFSIYLDCKWFGKEDESSVSNWSNATVLEEFTSTYELYPGSFQNGTWTSFKSGKELKTGNCLQENNVVNFSLGGKLPLNKDYCFRGFLGGGVVSKSKLTYNQVYDYWFEYTRLGLMNSYTPVISGGGFTYDLVKTEKIHELNIHGGIMIEGAGVLAGIGFDTNPGMLNVVFGFTIGK
jgi:hypothetical protein